jgi:hypothetical protein
MWPREHGAYAQLALPLVAALIASRPTLASGAFALAVCAVFLAHEPALVLLGHRGTRARRESAARARWWFAGALSVGTLFGAAGLVLSTAARTAVMLPLGLGLACVLLALRRQERSVFGEAVACAALTSASLPVAAAGGTAWSDALALWAVFCGAFLVSTVEVRNIAHREESRVLRLVTWAAALVFFATLAATKPLLALAPLPTLAVGAYMAMRSPSAKALRKLGWVLATSSLLTAVVAVIALRAAHPVADEPPNDALTTL